MTSEEIEQKRDMIRAVKKLDEISSVQQEQTSKPTNEHEQENIAEIVREEKHEFLAFARVFSGTLRKGQTLYILSPKHNPEDFLNEPVNFHKLNTISCLVYFYSYIVFQFIEHFS